MAFGICLDIAMLCVIALIMYVSMKRGFVHLALSFVSILLALAISFGMTGICIKPLARALTPATQRFIVHQSTRILPDEEALDTVASVADKVVTIFQAVLKKMNQGSELTAAVTDSQEALETLSYGIAYSFYGFLLFALLFAAVFALLRLWLEHFSFMERFPVLRVVDSSFSLIGGIVVSLIVLFIPAVILFSVVPGISGSSFTISESVFRGSLLLRLTAVLYPFG